MQDASAKFVQDMFQYVEEEVAKLVDELAAHGTDLQDIKNQVKNQVPEVQL